MDDAGFIKGEYLLALGLEHKKFDMCANGVIHHIQSNKAVLYDHAWVNGLHQWYTLSYILKTNVSVWGWLIDFTFIFHSNYQVTSPFSGALQS